MGVLPEVHTLAPKQGKGQENQYHYSVCQGRAGNSGSSCHQLEGLQTSLQTRGHWAEKGRYYGCEGTRLLPIREREVGQASQESKRACGSHPSRGLKEYWYSNQNPSVLCVEPLSPFFCMCLSSYPVSRVRTVKSLSQVEPTRICPESRKQEIWADGLGTGRKDATPERKASGPGLRRVTGASRQWVTTAPDTSSQVPCQRFSQGMETKYGL